MDEIGQEHQFMLRQKEKCTGVADVARRQVAARRDNRRSVIVLLAQQHQHLQAGEHGHPQVRDDQIEDGAPRAIEAFSSVVRKSQLNAGKFIFQNLFELLPEEGVVFDHQNSERRFLHRG